MNNISPDFKPSKSDSKIISEIIKFEKTGQAIRYFAKHADKLSNYAYWFGLSVLWVSYTGDSNLSLWKKMFTSTRPNRKTGLMKPLEINSYNSLPDKMRVWRAHRKNEADWISYTLSIKTALIFANQRNATKLIEYEILKQDIIALFLRRGEDEIIVLNKTKARLIKSIPIMRLCDLK